MVHRFFREAPVERDDYAPEHLDLNTGSSLKDLLVNIFEQSETDSKHVQARKETSQLTRVWYEMTGPLEHNHTVALYVPRPKETTHVKGLSTKTLIVYVDSVLRAVDFYAQRELYLARLECAGYKFDEIKFLRSKYPKRPKDVS